VDDLGLVHAGIRDLDGLAEQLVIEPRIAA
jgi:hypothetical protein